MSDLPLRDLFEAALALPEVERGAWIDTHCADPALRVRLQRMLANAAHATSDAMPLTPAAELAAAIGEVETLPAGTRIGPFELLELLGEGGYATVFRAARDSDGVRQEVALKLLRSGVYTPQAQRQFRRERQALAQLRHPNIAGLIEGGITDAGLAYIALELVDGVSITDYVRLHRLDLRARLGLFVQVCRAVEAAHRALIVHRDLKPSNVLVTAQGRVQLIDFGVAKLIDSEDATQTRPPGFTPAYAAPEQQRGEAITTATDVYALGVLLGELVTGQRLNDGSGRTPSSRVDTTAEPGVLPAPPRASQKLLRGDLDNIVLKAIEPEPERRYASAAMLADDIEAHLAGRPVAAHPPSRLYRARKFVTRHRGGVASTVAFSLAVFAALGIALWQARVARSQAQRAGEVQRFVESMFEPLESGNENSSAPTLQELVQRGLQRIDQRHPDDLQVRADLLGMFARIRDGMGEVRDNLALAESAWRASVMAFGEDDLRSLQARSLLGRVLRKDGQFARAQEELGAVRDAMQRLGIGGVDYAQVLDAQLNARVGERSIPLPELVALRRESVRLREADPRATPDDIGSGYNNLGGALEVSGDFVGARAAYQRAYELRHAFLGDSVGAALALANVGNTYSWTGQWRRSLQIMEDARRMYARANVTRNAYHAGLLIRLCDLGGRLEERQYAAEVCSESVAMNESVFGSDHGSFAMALVRDAAHALAAGDADGAGRTFARARIIFSQQEGDNSSSLRTADIAEAGRWRLVGDNATLRDRMLAVAAMPRYSDHWAAPLIFAWLAQACDEAPDPACGEGRREAAEAVLAAPRFASDPQRLPARTALARIDLRHGERERAVTELQREIAAATELGPSHSWLGEAYLVLAQALGDDTAATAARAQAQRIIEALPATHPLRQPAMTMAAGS